MIHSITMYTGMNFLLRGTLNLSLLFLNNAGLKKCDS